jgi:hypothetical protein
MRKLKKRDEALIKAFLGEKHTLSDRVINPLVRMRLLKITEYHYMKDQRGKDVPTSAKKAEITELGKFQAIRLIKELLEL